MKFCHTRAHGRKLNSTVLIDLPQIPFDNEFTLISSEVTFVADLHKEKTNLLVNPIVKQKMSKSEEELKRNGWTKQNTIGEPRLSECVELYKALGYEVRLEPVHPNEMTEACRKCYEKELGTVKTIYTRKK